MQTTSEVLTVDECQIPTSRNTVPWQHACISGKAGRLSTCGFFKMKNNNPDRKLSSIQTKKILLAFKHTNLCSDVEHFMILAHTEQ